MGVDIEIFGRLVELSTRFRPKGRTLMLGRQQFVPADRFAWRYEKVLSDNGLDLALGDLVQDDGFSETLFRKLGFGEIETMDFSPYEGAGVIHDLNDAAPKPLEKKFDFIFDGGTIEHVFNVPVALASMFRMLKVGGRFVSANGLNGWHGHGMYQFNPELVWSFWRRNCGCEVHDCRGMQKTPRGNGVQIQFPDPAEQGARLRLGRLVPDGRVYLYYEVERLKTSALQGRVLQSDYELSWRDHENAGETRFNDEMVTG
ncbi:MAG: hypothetical protein RIE24_23005 [Silicimonas sp.]